VFIEDFGDPINQARRELAVFEQLDFAVPHPAPLLALSHPTFELWTILEAFGTEARGFRQILHDLRRSAD
jgi:hypothetical protein